MNSVQLIGRATHDPQATTTANGTAVATFRLAIDRTGDGGDLVTVKTWDRVATTVGRYLTRGRRVAIAGRLQHDEWTDDAGNRAERLIVVANHVQFLDPPRRPQSAEDPEPDSNTDAAPFKPASSRT